MYKRNLRSFGPTVQNHHFSEHTISHRRCEAWLTAMTMDSDAE